MSSARCFEPLNCYKDFFMMFISILENITYILSLDVKWDSFLHLLTV